MNILVTSIGSLLGQNILDAMESRKDTIWLIGADNSCMNPRVFRSDILYRIPPTDDENVFFNRIIEIIDLEKPDIILAGRDHDAVLLSRLKEKYPEYSRIIPGGCSQAAALMQDKCKSHEFCVQNGIPYANTLSKKNSEKEIVSFCEHHGFPLVAKQATGFGSIGVCFIESVDQCMKMIDAGYIVQEYLDPLDDIQEYFKVYRNAMPLFFHVPESRQYAVQVIIGPDGSFSPVFTSVNRMVMGRCEYSKRIDNGELEQLGLQCAEKFADSGWYGPLNIQCKPDRHKIWKVNEFNPRMSGSTSARLRMGFDEIGLIVNTFRPDIPFPNLSIEPFPEGHVVRTLTDIFVPDSYIDTFNKNGIWKKS